MITAGAADVNRLAAFLGQIALGFIPPAWDEEDGGTASGAAVGPAGRP